MHVLNWAPITSEFYPIAIDIVSVTVNDKDWWSELSPKAWTVKVSLTFRACAATDQVRKQPRWVRRQSPI